MPFIDHLKSRVKPMQKRIVLPENNSDRALKAAATVAREGFAKIILVGDPEFLNREAKRLGVSFEGCEIINPATYDRMDELCAYFAKRREKKGMTVDKAREIMMKDTTFFGAGLVAMGDADGCVSGSMRTSADVIKAGLQVIGVRPGNKTVCSGFIVLSNTNLGEAGKLVFGDCGVIIDPTAEQLADISVSCANRARYTLGIKDVRVALLSYSTKGSGTGESVEKVQAAVELLKKRNVDFAFDGELQADAALVPEVGERKAPGSNVAGHANVLVFPNLAAANIGYKLVERFSGATCLGPLVQGLAKPVLDLSRGCSTSDIVDVVAVCASDAIFAENMKNAAR
jgi:phosphate acetyltransferase